jgi:hypothetical protein
MRKQNELLQQTVELLRMDRVAEQVTASQEEQPIRQAPQPMSDNKPMPPKVKIAYDWLLANPDRQDESLRSLAGVIPGVDSYSTVKRARDVIKGNG